MKDIFIFLIVAFLGFHFSFGQLTVKNSASIFVSNEIFYVDGNIELSGATDIILLRNEAQLIQGEVGPTNNTGLGYVSVFQEGSINPYHFNYWSSPVGNTTNTVINNPFKLDMLRDGDVTSSNFDGLASFTSNLEGTWSPLTLSTEWLYTFGGLSWNLITEVTDISSGNGFTLKGTDNSGINNGVGANLEGQRYEFRGKPNSGDITISVVEDEFYLLGNPYASALDTDQFILDNSSVIKDNTLYFWDQWGVNSHNSSDYSGNYATYLSSGLGSGMAVAATTPLIGAINNSTPKVPKRYLPIAQGFFIEAFEDGSIQFKNSQRPKDIFGTVSFKENYKESASDPTGGSVFLKSSSSKKSIATKNSNYYLGDKMKFPTLVFKVEMNQLFNRHLMLVLRPDADETIELGKDAKMFDDLGLDAFWTIDSKKFSIQSDAYSDEKKIPIGVIMDTDGEFKIAIEANEYNAPTNVYLYDKETDKEYLLDKEQTISLLKGEYRDRFEIRFQSATLSIEDKIIENLTVYYNNNYKELVVYNSNNIELEQVSIFDITGKKVFKSKDLILEEKHTFSLKNLSAGIYIVRSKTNKGFISTKKISVVK